jgi:cell division protein YceG involved in septum cleavage
MLKKILIVLLFLLVLVALALGFGYQLQQQKLDQPLALTAERSLLISKGTGFGALAIVRRGVDRRSAVASD